MVQSMHAGMADLGPTSISSCGLALALPAALDDVEAALTGGRYSDYVGRSGQRSAVDIWHGGLARVAAGMKSLADHARSRGVRVIEHAAREHLTSLFEECDVVTVVAHWRGPDLTPADLRCGTLSFARRVADDPSVTAGLLREGLPPNWERTLHDLPSDHMRSSRLAEMLDLRLAREPALVPPVAGTSWSMNATTRRHFNRACLDAWAQDAIVPGNRLELADGLHSADEIGSCIPTRWRGIADFSNCQSAQLIDAIKRDDPERLVVANERETNPLLRFAVLHVVYDMVAETRANYADARIAVARGISREKNS